MRLTDIRTELGALSLRPSKRLGQNFLHDANLARAISRAAIPAHASFAVEIGPGLGSLTSPLLERCDKLLVIEKDARLAAWLAARFPRERVEVVHADAACFDWRPLLRHGPVPLAGNLPYCATSPILRNFLAPVSPFFRATFAVQSEFAERLTALPGTPDYSALTVRVRRLWNVRRERMLPPSVFHPEPGVDSALAVLERRPPRDLPPVRAEFFNDIVQRGFSQRRKQLRPMLGADPARWAAWCEEQGVAPTCRAEDLDVRQWVNLARTLDPSAGAPAQDEEEHFDVVDGNNTVLGTAPRGEVHGKNLLHRSAHVLVLGGTGELLLQKRSAWKNREPLKWDSSAAGHLAPGEDYASGAARETFEELGIRPALQRIGGISACANTGGEFVEVFTAHHTGPFVLPPAEIEDALFFPLEEVDAWVAARPRDFAPGFLEVWRVAAPILLQ